MPELADPAVATCCRMAFLPSAARWAPWCRGSGILKVQQGERALALVDRQTRMCACYLIQDCAESPVVEGFGEIKTGWR